MKPQPPRTPSRLSDSTHHWLNMYALAASAAGVGMLALAQPADAKIIYTKTYLVIAGDEEYGLDLNHDKIIDFTLANFWSSACPDSCWQSLYLKPAAGNSEIGYVSNNGAPFAAAMKKGSTIGPKGHFLAGKAVMQNVYSTAPPRGPWNNVSNGYLGLKFQTKGKTHYGWARMSVNGGFGYLAETLTGYAYETIPNKAIIAGKTHGADVITIQPATRTRSLGRLALGRQ